MARADGRIEPGQPIASSISARAWNRAQDAADIVFGDRMGANAAATIRLPAALDHVVYMNSFSPFRQIRFGMIAFHQWEYLPSQTAVLGQQPPTRVGMTYAQLATPVGFGDRRITAQKNFGVLVGGTTPPPAYGGSQMRIRTHGTCLAMVRKNPGAFLPRVRSPVIRYSTDTGFNLLGIAEDTDCGPAELVYWTNIRPFEVARQEAEGLNPTEALDATLENVFYAVIRL
jgi:hypothetical protein